MGLTAGALGGKQVGLGVCAVPVGPACVLSRTACGAYELCVVTFL